MSCSDLRDTFTKGQCGGQVTVSSWSHLGNLDSLAEPRGAECQSPTAPWQGPATAQPQTSQKKEEGGILFLDTIVAKPGSTHHSRLPKSIPHSVQSTLTCALLSGEPPPRPRDAGVRWPLLAQLLADWPTQAVCLQLAWTGRGRPQLAGWLFSTATTPCFLPHFLPEPRGLETQGGPRAARTPLVS